MIAVAPAAPSSASLRRCGLFVGARHLSRSPHVVARPTAQYTEHCRAPSSPSKLATLRWVDHADRPSPASVPVGTSPWRCVLRHPRGCHIRQVPVVHAQHAPRPYRQLHSRAGAAIPPRRTATTMPVEDAAGMVLITLQVHVPLQRDSLAAVTSLRHLASGVLLRTPSRFTYRHVGGHDSIHHGWSAPTGQATQSTRCRDSTQ